MKFLTYILLVGILLIGKSCKQDSLVDHVNPFIGSSTSVGVAGIYHGLGKTIPGATTPFGMVQLSPNTVTGGDNGSGYSYEHQTIEGFAMTQMSGVGWFGDLGNFLVMPTTGPLQPQAGKENARAGYRSRYDKQSEKASVGWYEVHLTDYNIGVELTAAPHSGMMRFTFPQHQESRIQIDLARRVGGTSTEQKIEVLDAHHISGWMKCTPEGGGWGDGEGKSDYTVYFYAEFSKPLKDFGIWEAQIPDTAKRNRENVQAAYYQDWVARAKVQSGRKQAQGKHIGFYTNFDTRAGEQVMMKVGISFVDEKGALHNLKSEIADWDMEAVHQRARGLWATALDKMKVSGGTREDKTIFYTALYRTMMDPRTLQDVDGRYPTGNGQVDTAYGMHTRRTIFSGWDVFRSQFPLQTIINPRVVNDVLRSLIDLANEKQLNYFERWEMMNAYSGCMIGNPAVNVLAEAYAKNIRDFDVNKAYLLALGSVNTFGNGDQLFTPGKLGISLTLEYAYSDWCLAMLEKQLGKARAAAKSLRRAQAYKTIFDSEKKWFRPKDENGAFLPWPANGREEHWYGTIESNPYQQGWFVPHDVNGLAALLGGKDRMINDLNDFFEQTPVNFSWNDYYNHANEPVHHVPFLFNKLGRPSLTQKWSQLICRRAYRNEVEEGLVGNEDVGQMSAWYVLAASGLHPIAPADGTYEITSPIFEKIQIQVGTLDGAKREFRIIAKRHDADNIYISAARLNGKPLHQMTITHADLLAGGELILEMSDKPKDIYE
ncbi:GH92 family glycosyl hydrolase [Sphingobacterium griseoflavum]|uniref:Alpha-1,2-mannosidase n=1 Tax=Sphingobacterium griseoflavum TaxID=1474952 RepID=A0ABQ3HXG8_9SPHI|nr:GH92 family glycosyl hydrolase [Sphingobacterium griseoflavum]GHE35701.1 hypothetical protein GCM10017764_18750 [Sphingobacterium griseoflavum]